jgi:hypothetical protein
MLALGNSEQAFFEKISQGLFDVVKRNPAVADRFARIPQLKDDAGKNAGVELIKREMILTDSECERLLAILKWQRNPTPRSVGEPLAVQVRKTDNVIHFSVPPTDFVDDSRRLISRNEPIAGVP